MNTPEKDEMLHVGTINGVYGIKGWVKVHALTDPVSNILSFGHWKLKRRDSLQSAELKDGRPHGKGLIVKLAGVDTRDDAEKLRGTEIWVSASALPELEPGEFYWHQLQGLRVWCEHDEATLLLGEIDHLIDTGANDVMVLKACDGSIDERERLIPFLMDQVVRSIDRDTGEVWVQWHPED